jgi:hypothetical protein
MSLNSDIDHQSITLEGVINNSYVGWQNIPIGNTRREHAQFLEKARYNSYFVWLPIICTQAAVHALDEYIEVLPTADRITWGSDTWTSEEALGALLAFQHILVKVLAQKVTEEYIDIQDARLFVEKVLFRNAKNIYKLELPDNIGCLNG